MPKEMHPSGKKAKRTMPIASNTYEDCATPALQAEPAETHTLALSKAKA